MDVLETLDQDATEELQLQLKVFYENRDEDFDEFAQRFDNIRLELDDVDECFELIKNLVMDTSAEPYFLSVLQHLVCIRDDAQIRPAYFKLIEVCVFFANKDKVLYYNKYFVKRNYYYVFTNLFLGMCFTNCTS